jgi:hypothetical protein
MYSQTMDLPSRSYDPDAGVGLILGVLFSTITGCALLSCTCCIVTRYMEYKQKRVQVEDPPKKDPDPEKYIQTVLPDHSIAIAVRECS